MTPMEVAEKLGWPGSRVYSYIRSGILDPTREGRNLVLGFRDLVILRAADDLLKRQVSPAQVKRALSILKDRLPDGKPLSAAGIDAAGNTVVFRDQGLLWDIQTGQGQLDFSRTPANPNPHPTIATVGQIAPVERKEDDPTTGFGDRETWLDKCLRLEQSDRGAALACYDAGLAAEGNHCDGLINSGRLLQLDGNLAEAERRYRLALTLEPANAIACFNLGTVLEDRGEVSGAMDRYRLASNELIDARYNLARLLERSGRTQEAIAEMQRILRSRKQ